ncbi:MAG: hypothetical protein QME60_02175 [Verrucomicrobiota bacterium]|nr:hypothetical protein [Verrucomicrobiota bacterium]
MSNDNNLRIWVAVRVQRGFVADIRAYNDRAAACRTERSWRQRMNPDYDETGLSAVAVNMRHATARVT